MSEVVCEVVVVVVVVVDVPALVPDISPVVPQAANSMVPISRAVEKNNFFIVLLEFLAVAKFAILCCSTKQIR